MNNLQNLPLRYFSAGDKIAIAGKKSAGLYFIEKGQVEIYSFHGTRRVHIAYVGENDIIGEIGLIDDAIPNAHIIVIEDTVCRFMDKAIFQDYILKSNPFVRALMRLFSRRIKRIIALSEHHHAKFH